MNHITDVSVDGTSEAGYAEHQAEEITRMIDDGRLTTEAAIAHGARGVIYAILAVRKTLASVIADNSDALTEVDSTLTVLVGLAAERIGDSGPAEPPNA